MGVAQILEGGTDGIHAQAALHAERGATNTAYPESIGGRRADTSISASSGGPTG